MEDLLSSILNLKCGWHPSTSRRRTSSGGIDSVDFLQSSGSVVICQQLQPSHSSQALIALAFWSSSWSRHSVVLMARGEAKVLGLGIKVEGWGGVVGEEMVTGNSEVGGWSEVLLVIGCEVEL